MELSERTLLVERLRASRDALLAAVADVSDVQAKFQPAPDSWSIEGVVEHLAITEHGMLRLITTYSEPLASADDGAREAELEERVRIRKVGTMDAPERVCPTGRFGSLSKALKLFVANRERTMEYIQTCSDNLRARALNHPLGRMTGRECVGAAIAHPLRHVDQINEIRSTPGYPTS